MLKVQIQQVDQLYLNTTLCIGSIVQPFIFTILMAKFKYNTLYRFNNPKITRYIGKLSYLNTTLCIGSMSIAPSSKPKVNDI